MSRSATLLLSAFLLAGIPTMAGCSSQQYDPRHWHDGFVAGLQNNVGRQFNRVKSTAVRSGETGGWAPDAAFVSRTELPSGHIAYKYRYQGTCRYTFEVNPKTDLIVAASWEGEASHCAIVP
ncbi:MAG: hypothetical protein IE917_15095 [Betaproteobacteria bacterium]|nr:hypothetical protein [Betaproteobacteria bacterium]